MTRDPEASEPFTVADLDRVIFGCETDPAAFLGGAAKFLAYTGAHISVLSGGYERTLIRSTTKPAYYEWTYHPPIRSAAIRGNFIYWRRPKNQKQIGMPLSRHLKPWLGEYLDGPRPHSDERYRQLFNRVGAKLGIQVNPLRFRHTCAVLLYHVYKMDAKTIERLLGVSAQTLTTYVLKPQFMVQQELAAAGW